MLPHFSDYITFKNGVKSKEKDDIYVTRLKLINKDEKNILEMKEGDLKKFFIYSLSTNFNIKSSLRQYLEWLKTNYGEDISEIKYVLSCLKFDDDYSEKLFYDIDSLLHEVDTIEEEVFEMIIPDDKNKDEIRTRRANFMRLRVIYILLWMGLNFEDMVAIYKHHIKNGKVYVPTWEREFEFDPNSSCNQVVEEALMSDLSFINGNSENLLRTDSVRTLSNVSYLAIGRVDDKRLHKNNVKKAGYFARFNEWEKRNNRQLCVSDDEIILELSRWQIAKSQISVKLTEYRKYLLSFPSLL